MLRDIEICLTGDSDGMRVEMNSVLGEAKVGARCVKQYQKEKGVIRPVDERRRQVPEQENV